MALSNNGLVHVASHHSVKETLQRLEQTLASSGITVFARIDHSGEAAKAGLTMPPTELLVFGNPKGGTPAMLAAPSLAIDLPLKVLVWEDAEHKVWASYNSPDYLKERHGVPENLIGNISGVGGLVAKAVE